MAQSWVFLSPAYPLPYDPLLVLPSSLPYVVLELVFSVPVVLPSIPSRGRHQYLSASSLSHAPDFYSDSDSDFDFGFCVDYRSCYCVCLFAYERWPLRVSFPQRSRAPY